jgi:hypothetical protein
MTHLTRLLVLTSLTLSGSALAAGGGSTPPTVSTVSPQPGIASMFQGADVPLVCSGGGSSDVSSIHHSVTNTTGHVIPKGTNVYWSTSTKKNGHITLGADLAPGAQISASEPGQTNSYSCTAHFFAGPADFVVKEVQWKTATEAMVLIVNQNPWTDGSAQAVKLEALGCPQTPVAQTIIQVPAIAHGKDYGVGVYFPRGKADYLRATANYDGAAPESNKANNTNHSPDFNTNKSCTPQ